MWTCSDGLQSTLNVETFYVFFVCLFVFSVILDFVFLTRPAWGWRSPPLSHRMAPSHCQALRLVPSLGQPPLQGGAGSPGPEPEAPPRHVVGGAPPPGRRAVGATLGARRTCWGSGARCPDASGLPGAHARGLRPHEEPQVCFEVGRETPLPYAWGCIRPMPRSGAFRHLSLAPPAGPAVAWALGFPPACVGLESGPLRGGDHVPVHV